MQYTRWQRCARTRNRSYRRGSCQPGEKRAAFYSLDSTPEQKIATVAQQVYGAASVVFSDSACEKLKYFTRCGFGALPVCLAKTQYSLSDDPEVMGVPTGWTLHITDILLSAGAGFLVVISGNMVLMPGLERTLRGFDIDVDPDGNITGLN